MIGTIHLVFFSLTIVLHQAGGLPNHHILRQVYGNATRSSCRSEPGTREYKDGIVWFLLAADLVEGRLPYRVLSLHPAWESRSTPREELPVSSDQAETFRVRIWR
jgi:hypothetical protein